MKALFIGGIKSGKSKNAEEFILANSATKPIYLATAELFDDEMKERVELHKKQRGEAFATIEDPLKLYDALSQTNGAVLVECVSVWINNMLHYGFSKDAVVAELERLFGLERLVVFVINDVSSGVIPDNALAREFVDINGTAAQLIASHCDEVYHTIAGIKVKIK